jgi:transposase
LPPENVPLAGCFNASQESGDDEDSAGTLHALVFKQETVRLVQGGQSIAAPARPLGMVEQTLFNSVGAQRGGHLKGADSKVASAEQMEISQARAELARVKMERDILAF